MVRAKTGGCSCMQNGGGGGVSKKVATLMLVVIIALITLAIWLWIRSRSHEQVTPVQEVIIATRTSTNEDSSSQLNDVRPNKLPRYNSVQFQQVGILTSPEANGDPMILPLYGKRMSRHHRWQYYAASEKPVHLWRVPVYVEQKRCDETLGCPEIQDGDTVNVPIYPNRTFVASMYKLDAPQYFATIE